MEGTGAAQVDPSLSVDSALSAMLLRKDLDAKAVSPKDEYVTTKPRQLAELGPVCWSVKRFELVPNSINRLAVRPGEQEDAGKVQKVDDLEQAG